MKIWLLIALLLFSMHLCAQTPQTSCGQKQVMENLFRADPARKTLHEQIEAQLYQYNRTKHLRPSGNQKTAAIVYLPVVVHIVHNNGPENISNAQVQAAIQHLNEAFANTGYYDPSDGVNTQIQFCLAKRDPNGNSTNGINRVVSSMTVLNGYQDPSIDESMKDLSRWDPLCYINIWVIKDIPGGVVGYAYLPSAHGSGVDGIVLEAGYFGSSYSNDVVIIHEIGHYLGLYHTFDGGCTNNDCNRDGDRVCDTPPDKSTVYASCNASANSCSTDAQSGFSTDQNDLLSDYMDYGNWNCMKVFTQGQSDRMNWTIQNTRRSLLGCKACADPCPAPVTANFTASANNVTIGTLVNFTNSSSNAASYRWYLNNVLQSTAVNYAYTFNAAGTYVVKLVAVPADVTLCDSAVKYDTVRVTCPVTANFSPLNTTASTNQTVNFTNSSTGANLYSWYVNGALQGTGLNFSYAFTTSGNYVIKLRAGNGVCTDSIAGTVVVEDTCLRYTFQKTFGGSGDDIAYDVRSTTDGGYIIAGKTKSFGNGGYDGYLAKMDNLGNVQWSRTYGGTGDDVINRILQTADGGYIFAGVSASYGNAAGDAWVVKLDGSGQVSWARRFGENSASGEAAYNLCITSDGGYAFIGSQNRTPGLVNVMVWKLDGNGNLVWSKVIDSGLTDEGGTIMEDNGGLLATGQTRANSSYHDVFLIKFDLASGNILWTRKYDVDSRNNFAMEIFKTGNTYKYHITSLNDFTVLNSARNMILTIDNNGNATSALQVVPPDFGAGPVVVTPDGGIITVYNEQNSASDFNIIKLSSTGGVQWAKKYPRAGVEFNSIMRPSQDGGYITIGATNPSTSNDIYVAKTDIQGYTAGCDTASITATVQNLPFTNAVFTWSTLRDASFAGPININVLSAPATTQSNNLCFGTTCVEPGPVDTCEGFKFQKLIGGTGNDEGYDIKRSFSGGYIVAGKSNNEALIMELDSKGKIVWSKTYGSPGEDGFNSIILTKDGNYVAAGWSKFGSSPTADVFVVKVSRSGNLIWGQSYGNGTASGEYAKTIAETDDGGFVVSMDYNTGATTVQPMFLKLDASGNLLWTTKLGVNNAGQATGAIPIGNTVVVSGVVAKMSLSSFNDGFIAKLRLSDGALLWTRRIESENRSNRLENMRLRNNELVFGVYNSDSWTTGQVTPWILKTDTNGNIIKSQFFSIAGLNRQQVHMSMQPTQEGGFIISLSEMQNNTSPRLVKMASSGGVSWVRNYSVYPSQTLFSALEDSTGYVTVGRAATQSGGNQDILLIKTTASGALAGNLAGSCNVTSSSALTGAMPAQSVAVDASFWNGGISSINLTPIPANVVVTDVVLNVVTPCIDTLPCTPPPVDTCNNNYFQKIYDYRHNDELHSTTETSEGYILVAGSAAATNTSEPGDGDALLMKLYSNGSIAWSRSVGGHNYDHFYRARENRDKTIIAVGVTNSFANAVLKSMYVAKFAANGNLLWTRNIMDHSAAQMEAFDVRETSDGGYLICGVGNANTGVVVRLDANGNMKWTNFLKMTQGAVQFNSLAIVENQTNSGHDTAYIAGYYIENFHKNGVLIKMNSTLGNIYWTKNYDYDKNFTPTDNVFKSINIYGDQLRINMESTKNDPVENWMLNMDVHGRVLKTRKLITPSAQGLHHSSIGYPSPDDAFVIAHNYGQNNTYGTHIAKIDSAGKLQWSKLYNLNYIGQMTYNTFISSRNDIFITGYEDISQPNNLFAGFIIKTNQYGDIPGSTCINEQFPATAGTGLVSVRDHTWQSINLQLGTASMEVNSSSGNAAVKVSTKCEGVVDCNSIDILGEDTLCNRRDTLIYTALRNFGCSLPVSWSIDTSFAAIIRQTDSTIILTFKKDGLVTLRGTIYTSCDTLYDSLNIRVFRPGKPVRLGPDQLLCKISTLTLNAGAGFKTYRWQDGAADSTYTLHQPGTYWVEAWDDCGNVFRDTIEITQAPDVPFDLGPDLTKCNTDTVVITAPPGFAKYSWAADYNISGRYNQAAKAWPVVDTIYSVMAETANGCLVYDTIRVKVNTSPRLDLGADTSFCENDSIAITAPAGFVQYHWNTGETSRQIIAKAKGIYYVEAMMPNGCISKDTLEVQGLHALPQPNLGKDTLICMNGSYVFDAGNFASYLWNDGSVGRTFTASQVGEYWVKVYNANGCTATDTAYILRIAALPQNFLDTATEFCPFEKATLTVKGTYNKYRWSNGSIARSIEVNVPARYWLEVTNEDGCINREYINVKHKHCTNSIDFPNAFSPNNDWLHDTYKPIIKGHLTKYKLTIYNRWGQRVFETSDPTKAWDATLAGKPQDSGTFVWYCEYQFAGEETKAARGTLVVVR